VLGLNLDPATLVAVAIFLLVGFPVHEFSHALAAYRLGDGTAKMFGRLTLNPLVHLDPMGSAILVLSALVGGFFIGWAKPTPVNPSMLRGGRRAEAYVAAAGPLSNLVMAVLGAIALRLMVVIGLVVNDPVFGLIASSESVRFVAGVIEFFVFINVALFIFNLIPIPPLDGSKVMFSLMNPRTVWQIRPRLEQYGFLILIIVMFVPVINGASIGGRVLFPVLNGIVSVLVGF
jgi:Zn-dependent protease